MRNFVYLLMVICFISLNNSLYAQKAEKGPIVSIKGYKNANNKKIAKNPIKAEKILDLPNIALYRVYSTSGMTVSQGTNAGGGAIYGNVDVSDTFWYCKRPGEDIAFIVSWTFNTQVNKNNIFRKNAAEYFKDYPELSQKIKNKDYKYDDLLEVVQLYNDWKSGK